MEEHPEGKMRNGKFSTQKQIERILDSSPNIECQLNEVTQI